MAELKSITTIMLEAQIAESQVRECRLRESVVELLRLSGEASCAEGNFLTAEARAAWKKFDTVAQAALFPSGACQHAVGMERLAGENNEIVIERNRLRAEVARLTAELTERTKERDAALQDSEQLDRLYERAKQTIRPDLQSVLDIIPEYEAMRAERDGLAACIEWLFANFGESMQRCDDNPWTFVLPRAEGYDVYQKLCDGMELCRLVLSAHDAAITASAKAEGLADYLTEAREFSRKTFGEGNRTLGVTKHIEKEIAEVRVKPFDLTEWVDIIILACDGYWRHGGKPESLLGDMLAKLAKNKLRTWPKPTSEDVPVEHDRSHDDPLNPELGPEHREYWVRKVELDRMAAQAEIVAQGEGGENA